MKLLLPVIFITITLFSCSEKSKVEVIIPSSEMESDYIWQNIQNTYFFEQNRYQVSLPDSELIENLKYKASTNSLEEYYLDSLKLFVYNYSYKKSDYLEAEKKILSDISKINKAINRISGSINNWDFKIFDKYKVILTLYGPGGSYDPDNGTILIMTDPNGNFKGYDDPAYTIIHEIIHIGIEESIIGKFNIPHSLKERIVDLFIMAYFKDLLPDYKLQDSNKMLIDEYLADMEDFENLPQVIEKFLETSRTTIE